MHAVLQATPLIPPSSPGAQLGELQPRAPRPETIKTIKCCDLSKSTTTTTLSRALDGVIGTLEALVGLVGALGAATWLVPRTLERRWIKCSKCTAKSFSADKCFKRRTTRSSSYAMCSNLYSR